MAHVHFFLNPKGGTGKSLFSYIMAQYLSSKGLKTTCIDCDPVTPTLIAYEALHALRIDIMEDNNIEKIKFDKFVELIIAGEEDEHFIIDNGTSSFVALADYLVANGIVSFLRSMGHVVTFHVIMIWLNPFFGKIERDGKSFDQFSVFAENSKFVDAIINYPDFPKDMFGKSFALLQKDRLTFAEVCDVEKAPKGYDRMTCHRLGMIRTQVFNMLDATKVI